MWDFLAQEGVQRGINQAILLAGLVTARLVPVVYLVPYLGGQAIPQQVKMGIALALTVMVYPAVWQSGAAGALPEASLHVAALVVKELVVGLMLGFVAALVFEALRVAGQAIDNARGQTMATSFVPQLKTQASVTADFLYQLGVVMFLLIGGHRLMLAALTESYVVVPPQSFPPMGEHLGAITFGIVRLSADAITLGVLLSFPAVAAIVLANVMLALINKAAPQINVFFLGMPLKAALGVAVVLFGLHVLVDQFVEEATLSIERVEHLVELMAG
ncbi:MAG: flagellar biosynthetic protein FliR [Persicimonas sp.]